MWCRRLNKHDSINGAVTVKKDEPVVVWCDVMRLCHGSTFKMRREKRNDLFPANSFRHVSCQRPRCRDLRTPCRVFSILRRRSGGTCYIQGQILTLWISVLLHLIIILCAQEKKHNISGFWGLLSQRFLHQWGTLLHQRKCILWALTAFFFPPVL